jgi:23S rRNA (cytidine1920-2'-O)/16S rRNA (cytidine1409-2'-O)-methyltransferase
VSGSRGKTPARERVDVLLVARGLAASREKARALVLAGAVYVGERRVDKAGETVPRDATLAVRGRDHEYVSRGGVKLAGALDAFERGPAGTEEGLRVAGAVCADFGASTGGFTDCLLRRGAARVYAIDVGFGQLHARLRADPRVVVMERTNARALAAGSLPEPLDLVVIDASFISLGKLLPSAHALLRDGGDCVPMVKPQFEVGRGRVGKRGVVRDPATRAEAIARVAEAARALGFVERGRVDSVLPGPEGNVEAFLWLRKVGPRL